MKIALINFPILDVGGITTWAEAIRTGYRRLGHEVQHFYATSGRNYHCDPSAKTFIGDKYKRGEKLDSLFISYGVEDIGNTIKTLDEYDVIHFIHPSPHPTQGHIKSSNPLGWVDLYKKTKAKKIVTMHDIFWHRTNSWFVLVNENIDVLVASQKPHYKAVEAYPTLAKKIWDYFPLDLINMNVSTIKDLHSRCEYGMVAHQWLQWKNHDKMIEALKGVTLPFNFYAGGKVYHDLLANKTLQKFFKRNEVEEEDYENDEPAEHTYSGFISRDALVGIYGEALLSVDGSTRGYNNYTHFEPMAYGCISMVHEKVLEKEDNSIPEDCCVPFNWDNLKEKIEWIRKHTKEVKKIRENAYEFIKRFDCKTVAQNIISVLETPVEITDEKKLEFSSLRKVAEEAALLRDGWNCSGTCVKEDPNYESYCAKCYWLDICATYTQKIGYKYEPPAPEVKAEELPIQATQVESVVPQLVETASGSAEAKVEVESPKLQEDVVKIGDNTSTVEITINLEKKEIKIVYR